MNEQPGWEGPTDREASAVECHHSSQVSDIFEHLRGVRRTTLVISDIIVPCWGPRAWSDGGPSSNHEPRCLGPQLSAHFRGGGLNPTPPVAVPFRPALESEGPLWLPLSRYPGRSEKDEDTGCRIQRLWDKGPPCLGLQRAGGLPLFARRRAVQSHSMPIRRLSETYVPVSLVLLSLSHGLT
ncbi:hypothetical protein LY76DRAFT_44566 [Colletotrichum caudatum]|nr:hypothetical protein LY76DRAFT_44566 [Colletotrichum caudatum]